MDQLQWLTIFKAEYERRTGITWNEGAGATDQDAIERYWPGDPVDAVEDQIERYGLIDITDGGGW